MPERTAAQLLECTAAQHAQALAGSERVCTRLLLIAQLEAAPGWVLVIAQFKAAQFAVGFPPELNT